MNEAKKNLRQAILGLRRLLGPDEVSRRSNAALQNLYRSGLLPTRGTVALYAAADLEVLTEPLFQRLSRAGLKVALPRVRGKGPEIDFFAVTDWAGLVKSRFGIPEPPANGDPVALAELDFVLVPGIAFDAHGGRLGYGMGCYDRALKETRPEAPRVGIGYDFQLVEAVPKEAHDVLLTAVVIERETLLTGSGGAIKHKLKKGEQQ